MHFTDGAHFEALLPTSLDSGELLGAQDATTIFPEGCHFSMVCSSVINT